MGLGGGSTDPLVVSCVELCGEIMTWIQDHEDGEDTEWGGNSLKRLGGLQYISHYSGIDVGYLRKVLRQEHKYISLANADKILTAMGAPHALHRMTVVANPMWSQEKWTAYMRERGCEPE